MYVCLVHVCKLVCMYVSMNMYVCIAGGYAINAIEARHVMEGATSLLMCDLMMSRWMVLMGHNGLRCQFFGSHIHTFHRPLQV